MTRLYAIIIGLICAGLIFVVVPLTTNFNRLGVFINELKPADAYDFFATMTEARTIQEKLSDGRASPLPAVAPPQTQKRGQPRPAVTAPPPKPIDQAEINKLEADLKPKIKYLQEANSRISVNLDSINRVIDSSTGAPRWYALTIQSYGLDEVWRFLLYRVLRLEEPDPLIAIANNEDISLIQRAVNTAKANCGGWAREENEERQNPKSITVPKRPGAYWKSLCDNVRYAEGIGLRVIAPGVILAASEARQHAESITILLGSAILPVLYGLLGASVFLLRAAWGDDNRLVEARPLNSASFLRLALGGIAGLAIGWFWVPSAKPATDVATLTTTPFALAFLAGFSIELLFRLLDRILNAVNPAAQQNVQNVTTTTTTTNYQGTPPQQQPPQGQPPPQPQDHPPQQQPQGQPQQ